MQDSEDIQLHRKADIENLSKIPVIENEIGHIKEALERIERNTEGFSETKTNVKWLMGWHWKIVIGVISSILTAGVVGIYAFLKR